MKNTNLLRLAFLLFAGLSIFLSSCQPKEEGDKKYVIGFSQCTSDSWREAVLLEMQIEASNYRNVELVVYNAMDNSSRQVSQIRKLISQNVDVLIISPNEAVPITDVAVEAYRKGIPTIIHDRKIQSDEYTVSIGANNYNIGSAIGEYINGQLPPNSKILEIWGLEGSSPAMERHDGFIDHLRSDKNFQVTQVFGKWHYNSAYDAVNRLATFADIDLVYAHNDVMALAARDVIMKRDSVSGKRIRFIGIDGVYGDGAGLQAVADEKLEASFQYPTGGAISIQVAMQIINGEKVKKNYVLNTAIINRGNAKTILAQSEQLNHYQKRINRQKQEEDNLLSRFKFLRNSTILILALMLLIIPLLGYVMYMNLRVKNKNKELHDKNQLVEAQKEELAVKNSQIENISNQKLQFFTNISHEIRTPLTLILGPVNKLIKNSKLDPSIQEDVALMKRNVDRLYRIVNQILDFRRIDNDKMKLILRQVDLIGMVREVFDYFTGIAEEKQIHYRFSTNIDELNIYIDVNKIEQVLVNIISNAFKYSDSGGDISVRITGEAETVLLEVEDQADILEEYSKLINYFDPSVKFELVLFNRQVNEQMLTEQFDIPWQEDDFNDIREEYTEMLKKQAAKGNNGIIKSKYLIFGVESNGYKEAKSRLNNIEKDVIRNLNNIGTLARGLDGKERLRILHEYFNQDTMEPFRFSFKDLAESGKSVKDYIAPPGFDFRYPNRFKSGNMYGCVSYLDIIAPKFTDELIKHLLDIDANLTISMHMQTEDPVKAIKKLKAVISNIQKMKIEEQKKAVRSGYDMDILPTDIVTYEKDTLEFLDDLNTSNQKMINMTFLITCYGRTKRELESLMQRVSGIIQQANCDLRC